MVLDQIKKILVETMDIEEEKITLDAKLKDDTVTIVVQVNGKVRGKMDVDSSISKEDMESKAFTIDNVKEFTKDREVVKVITVPKKLINIVVK